MDWVGLSDVAIAADRGATAYGPELCGFVVLEASSRVRDVGGGVIDGHGLAIGTQGHVALTAPPSHATEADAVAALRGLLAALLTYATSTTPALRQCARKVDARGTFATLERELLAALIPLNRQANRRALARLARTTLEACESGHLDGEAERLPQAGALAEPSPLPSPPRKRTTPPPLPVRVAEIHVATAEPRPIEVDEPTVQQPPVCFDESPAPPTLEALADELDRLDARDEDQDLEVVSQLPPLASDEAPPTVSEAARPTVAARDQIHALVEGFSVSRVRDDRALSRDLKRMVDIETSVPPGVAAVRDDNTPPVDLEFADPSPLPSSTAAQPPSPPMRRGPGALVAISLAAAAFGIAMLAGRPGAFSGLLGPAAAPPGAAHGETPIAGAFAAPAPPAACEGVLTLENPPKDAEVLRRIGVAPSTVVVSIAAPIDLVATLEGHAPKRLRVDKAMFKSEATGLSAQASFALDAASGTVTWPSSPLAASPMRASDARAVLRLSSTPASAAVWAVVDPSAIPVPCGAPVDLLTIGRPAPPAVAGERRQHRVEWSGFAGSPPRASLRL